MTWRDTSGVWTGSKPLLGVKTTTSVLFVPHQLWNHDLGVAGQDPQGGMSMTVHTDTNANPRKRQGHSADRHGKDGRGHTTPVRRHD